MERLCEACHITLNKNAVHGDKNAAAPGGVRIGTPALTTRGFATADFERVAEHLHCAAELAVKLQAISGPKLKDFAALLDGNDEVSALRERVVAPEGGGCGSTASATMLAGSRAAGTGQRSRERTAIGKRHECCIAKGYPRDTGTGYDLQRNRAVK